MPFVDPPYSEHLDQPSAASLQIFSDDLAVFNTQLHFNQTCGGGIVSPSSGETKWPLHFVLQHRSRFLIYREADNDLPLNLYAAGDPDNKTYDLSVVADGEDYNILQLDNVDWLVPGMVYVAVNVRFAFQTNYI